MIAVMDPKGTRVAVAARAGPPVHGGLGVPGRGILRPCGHGHDRRANSTSQYTSIDAHRGGSGCALAPARRVARCRAAIARRRRVASIDVVLAGAVRSPDVPMPHGRRMPRPVRPGRRGRAGQRGQHGHPRALRSMTGDHRWRSAVAMDGRIRPRQEQCLDHPVLPLVSCVAESGARWSSGKRQLDTTTS